EPGESWKNKSGAGNPAVKYKALIDYRHGKLNMQRSRYEPGHFEPPHSHPEDELIYLLSGIIIFGNQRLTAGDTLHIPADTIYSLRTDEGGAEFLRVGLPIPRHSSDDI